jgi:ribulose-5-phosphate 4-epimerase/fuculose-1-phosphate aldolase
MFGWDDLVFTHLSARVPGPDHHFLINPYGQLFEEITASSLVKIDMDGNKVEESEYNVNPAGFTIHSAVHMHREDANCVMHLHTVDGTAVATQEEGLLPLNQTAQLIIGDLAYHDYEGVAFDHDERPRLQSDLGDKGSMLLRNHGTLTVGSTVAQAFTRMYFLERACSMQIATMSSGKPLYATQDPVIAKNEAIGKGGLMMAADGLIWPALLRKLDREQPGFRD